MKIGKGLLARPGVRRLLSWLGAHYLRLVFLTGRWTFHGFEVLENHWKAGTPVIACFWHSRMLMMLFAWRSQQPFWMLTSLHRDGQLIADVAAHFAIREIKGSTSRGGSGAVRMLLSVLERGDSVGITPDGPRGPRMRANLGAVKVAQLSGVPLVPVTYGVRHRRVLSTWDRFVIVAPFSRGVLVCGEEILVPRHADAEALEHARRSLERALNDITAEADRITGHAPIEPAATQISPA